MQTNQKEQLEEYLQDNITIAEMAEKLGVAKRTVGRWLKKYDLHINRKKKQAISLICVQCGIDFIRDLSAINHNKSKNIFCSKSCANTHSNHITPKRKLQKTYCKYCFGLLERESYKDQRTVCQICNPTIVNWSTVTYAEVKDARRYQRNSRIRTLARKNYLKSDLPKYCQNCGYDKHFEVCHIKDISSFVDTVMVTEINSLDNLIALCPNCHREFDYGDLRISIQKTIALFN